MLDAISAPNVMFALVGATGCAIVLLVLLRRGWDVNFAQTAAVVEGAEPEGIKQRIGRKLREADIPLTPEEFVRASAWWGMMAAAAVHLVWGYWGMTMIAFVMGPLLYWQYLEARRDRLYEQFMTDLALAVDDLREAYAHNPSPQQAFDLVAKSGPSMMRPHFTSLGRRLSGGRQSLAEALTAVAQDVGNPFFDELAEVLIVNEEKGGQITMVLERHSRALRNQVRLLQTTRSEQSRMRIESRVVAVAPFVLLAIIKLTAPIYADPYYNTLVPGQLTIAIIVLLTFAGYSWMNKLAQSGLTLRRFSRHSQATRTTP
ncbi:MAG: type II secretion system F family protein [Chloroflexota bacterium]